jgi:hypothetical protein
LGDWIDRCLCVVAVGEQADALKARAKKSALDILKLIKQLPEEPGTIIRRQLAKAATSVSMNYRATC